MDRFEEIIKKWVEKGYLYISKRKYLFFSPILYLIIVILPFFEKLAFIPDLFNISQLEPQQYFGLIVKAIASILGILMAVVLLNVQFSKEKLINVDNPLDSVLIRNSLYNSINLIGLSFLSYILIKSFESEKHLTIAYLIAGFFLIYIYSVYGVVRSIIGKSNRIKENLDSINSLDLNSFINLSRYRERYNYLPDSKLELLSKECDTYILKGNISAYERINSNIVSRGLELLDDKHFLREECDNIFSAIVSFWNSNLKTAVRAKDTHYFEMIWNSIKNIYVSFAEKRVSLINLMDIDLFIKLDFLKLHSKYNFTMPLSTAIDCIVTSFKSNLKNNCPPENLLIELIRFYDKSVERNYNGDSEMQWRHVIDILRILHDIQDTSIAMTDKEMFEKTTREIQDVCSDLFWTDFGIGNYQKGYIVRSMLMFSFYYSSVALEKELYSNTLNCYRIPDTFIRDRIEKQDLHPDDIKVTMKSLAEDLIEALKKEKLFADDGYGTLQDFCSMGISSLKHYDSNPVAKSSVDYTIRLLKYMKKHIEQNQLPNNGKIYLKIKSKVNHFINVTERFDNVNIDSKVVEKWRKLSNSFTEIDSEETAFDIVKWE